HRSVMQPLSFLSAASHNNLGVRIQEHVQRNSIGGSEHAVMLRDPCECCESVLCQITVFCLVGVSIEAQQSDCRRGISCGCGRVLQRFTLCAYRAQPLTISRSIYKATADRIVKACDHCVSNFAGKLEIAEISSDFVGVQTGNGNEGVIVQDSRGLLL